MTEAAAVGETPCSDGARRVPAPRLGPYLRQLRPALVGLILLTLITGGLYPAVIYAIGRLAFADQADGSLVRRGGVVVGSRLMGQPFARPQYFQPRPSAAGNGYDATQSGGANFAPANPKLVSAVSAAADAYRILNGLPANAPIPIDAVTSSGSGLDPHISPANAALQVPRIAKARGVTEATVRQLIDANTEAPDLGFIGQPRVSVLALNLALDRAAPMPKAAGPGTGGR
jgi:potassium-transporting ATPase KdpC subunit